MIRGILFDKDGTLLDFNATWLPRYFDAAQYLATQFPAAPDRDALMAAGGYQADTQSWQVDSPLAAGSNRDILQLWESTIGQPLSEAQCRRVADLFAAATYAPVLPHLRECLQALRDRQIRLGVATMDDAASAAAMVDKLGLHGVFDFVCGADSGYGVKPEPGMMQAFYQQCQVAPAAAMMVGDSPRDMAMGRNAAAALCVGVETGAHSRAALAPHADVVLADIGEIAAQLEALGM